MPTKARYVWLVMEGHSPLTAFAQKNKMVRWLGQNAMFTRRSELTAYRIVEGKAPEQLDMDELLEEAAYA